MGLMPNRRCASARPADPAGFVLSFAPDAPPRRWAADSRDGALAVFACSSSVLTYPSSARSLRSAPTSAAFAAISSAVPWPINCAWSLSTPCSAANATRA